MKIKINGKQETVGGPLNLLELVLARGLVPDNIVVEHNLNITSKADWQKIALKEDDSIEIVSFVGGG